MSEAKLLVLGNLAEDHITNGGATRDQPGGAALYGALLAARQGVSVRLVAAGTWPAVLNHRSVLPVGGAGSRLVASEPAVFDLRQDGERRHVRLLSRPTWPDVTLTEQERDTPLCLLAPVCGEISNSLAGQCRGRRTLCLQGWLRRFEQDGAATHVLTPNLPLPRRDDIMVFSEEDTDASDQLALQWAAQCSLVVLTRGVRGCTAWIEGSPRDFPSQTRSARDTTGAGDVAAAALLMAVGAGHLAVEAVQWAMLVAALRCETAGLDGVPTATRLRTRMAERRQRHAN